MSTAPVLTALFSGSHAALLAAAQLANSGFTPDQIQPIFRVTEPHPDTHKPARTAALILHPHHRSEEARSILLQHGAQLV